MKLYNYVLNLYINQLIGQHIFVSLIRYTFRWCDNGISSVVLNMSLLFSDEFHSNPP